MFFYQGSWRNLAHIHTTQPNKRIRLPVRPSLLTANLNGGVADGGGMIMVIH